MKKGFVFVLALTLILTLISGCGNKPEPSYGLYDGKIETKTGVYIDTQQMQLTFAEDACILYEEGTVNVGGTTYDLTQFKDGDELYYDVQTGRLTLFDYRGNIRLGTFHLPVYLCELNMNQALFHVDDVPVTALRAMQGKRVLCLGDSMTEGVGTTKVYSQYFQELCDFSQVTNYGLASSCIAPKVDDLPTWEAGIPSLCERYDTMEAEADIVIVFGGVNDWITGRELGEAGNVGTDTFYGAMRALCSGLMEKYPHAEIFFFSSPQNNYIDRPATDLKGTQWEGNTEGYNRKGWKFQDYVLAMEAVCKEKGVHFYSLTDVFPWGVTELGDNNGAFGIYGVDGLHPKAEGHALIASEMVEFIQKTYAQN